MNETISECPKLFKIKTINHEKISIFTHNRFYNDLMSRDVS